MTAFTLALDSLATRHPARTTASANDHRYEHPGTAVARKKRNFFHEWRIPSASGILRRPPILNLGWELPVMLERRGQSRAQCFPGRVSIYERSFRVVGSSCAEATASLNAIRCGTVAVSGQRRQTAVYTTCSRRGSSEQYCMQLWSSRGPRGKSIRVVAL